MKKTDDMISLLTEDLSPIQVQKPMQKIFLYTGIAWIVTLAVARILFSIRSDLKEIILNPKFLFSTVLAFLVCTCGFMCVVLSSFPGRKEVKILASTIIGLILILGAALMFWSGESKSEGLSAAVGCTNAVMLLGIGSFFIFMYAAKKLAPTNPSYVGIICGTAAAGIGATCLAFICPNENTYHLLVWHFVLPFVIFSTSGFFVGKKILRW